MLYDKIKNYLNKYKCKIDKLIKFNLPKEESIRTLVIIKK